MTECERFHTSCRLLLHIGIVARPNTNFAIFPKTNTALGKQAFPVVRYRTHDLTKVTIEPCACGRTHARMEKVRARTDDMLIIRGTNVFPSQFQEVLASFDEDSHVQ